MSVPGTVSFFNFSYARDTSREAVDENFRRAAGVFGTTSDAFVCVRSDPYDKHPPWEKEDAGKGVTKEKDYRDVDGLITNVSGLILGTFYADCVPLLFVDPVHHAIGCSHSGGGGQSVRWEKDSRSDARGVWKLSGGYFCGDWAVDLSGLL